MMDMAGFVQNVRNGDSVKKAMQVCSPILALCCHNIVGCDMCVQRRALQSGTYNVCSNHENRSAMIAIILIAIIAVTPVVIYLFMAEFNFANFQTPLPKLQLFSLGTF